MVTVTINGLDIRVPTHTPMLEAARFLGIQIPTLCYMDGLTAYGACRLCVVEVGEGQRAYLAASCTLPALDGMTIRTHSQRVMRARRMLLELYLATAPRSKRLQDLAAAHGVEQVRFKPKDEDCILCGLCVRYCAEQMSGAGIGMVGRGPYREVTSPFRGPTAECRLCGGCYYVCPVCEQRCPTPRQDQPVCGGCLNITPVCLEEYSDVMCFLDECGACVKAK